MRKFFLSYDDTTMDWLVFLGILLLACMCIAVFAVWFTIFRKQGKRRRKRRHHRHHKSPSLAELGGLPPRREENETGPVPPP